MTMTRQKPPGGIEWTRIRIELPDGSFIELPGWTWNPMTGCMHGCEWPRADGTMEICYAKKIAEGIAGKSYPHGFEHHYFHPNRLEDPLKQKDPAGIFTVSMGDMFGTVVPDEDINMVLDVMRRAHWHTFQTLSKYPVRLKEFDFPPNVWVGVSSPSGNTNNPAHGKRMLRNYLDHMMNVTARVRFFSVEPIWFDAAEEFRHYLDQKGVLPVEWIITGAMSSGEQPKPEWIQNLVEFCDEAGIPIFFKGNLEWNDWRAEFPQSQIVKPKTQLSLM